MTLYLYGFDISMPTNQPYNDCQTYGYAQIDKNGWRWIKQIQNCLVAAGADGWNEFNNATSK